MRSTPIALATTVALLALIATTLESQDQRTSPRGKAATEITGKWVSVEYGRPILRGRREIFGEGELYGKKVGGGAPVWRVGANKSTRLTTEHALAIGGKTVPAGEYSLFINLKSAADWELILSNWGAMEPFSRDDKENLWGAYGYTPDKDIVRASMIVASMPGSMDQLTIGFSDVTDQGGKLFIWWDDTMSTVDFTVIK